MYFEFIKDASPQTEELRLLHGSLYEMLKGGGGTVLECTAEERHVTAQGNGEGLSDL